MARRKRTPDPPPKARRPSLLDDPEKVALMEAAVQAGQPFSRAAAVAGVDERLFRGWMKRGRDAIDAEITHVEMNEPGEFERDDPYQEFAERIIVASAQGELRLLTRISKAAERAWRAAAWILERRFAADYTPAQRLELSGNSERPIQFATAAQHPIDRTAAAAEALDALVGIGMLPSDLAHAVETVTTDDD